MRFTSPNQRKAIFAQLNGCARSHSNNCGDFARLSNLGNHSEYNSDCFARFNSNRFSSHPKAIGSVWVGGDFVHGPRIRQPEEFEFIKNVDPSTKFYHFEDADKIPNPLPRGSKLVVGKLRKSGEWALQSTLIPKQSKLGKSLIKKEVK